MVASDIFKTVFKNTFGGFKSQTRLSFLISNPRMISIQAYQPPWLGRLGHGLEVDLELFHGLGTDYENLFLYNNLLFYESVSFTYSAFHRENYIRFY